MKNLICIAGPTASGKTALSIALAKELNGEIVSVNKNWLECLIEAMRLVPDIDDAETCVVFSGEGVSEDELDELSERLEEEFPMLEAEIIDGGQKLYRFIIGLS